jgi:predicted transglutaminase-like cysteine proteinase
MIVGGANASADPVREMSSPDAARQTAAESWTSGRPAGADFMRLGREAPPPLGFLNFCARRPEQCGFSAIHDPQRPVTSVSDRQRELYSRFYWPIAFRTVKGGDARLVPTSGDAEAPPGRFRWSPMSPTAAAGGSRVSAAVSNLASPDLAVRAGRPLPMTEALTGALESVNVRINRQIRYVSDDRRLYGEDDYWTLPLDAGGPAAGDCKDYVLEKRQALIAAGVPAEDLSIAIVQTPWGATHAVLLVSTERGEMVLDSLSSAVKPWRKTGYTWLERQAPGKQFSWVTVVAGQRFS